MFTPTAPVPTPIAPGPSTPATPVVERSHAPRPSTPTAPGFSFPISLDVAGRRCLVAGGGPLAREKADALREAGADVLELAAGGFSTDLLDGTFLFIVSGEDDIDPDAAFTEAERRGVLTNMLDDIPHCHFAFPSVVQRGSLKLAISTGGKAPALARQVRLQLEDRLPESLGALVEAYAAARLEALPRRVPFEVWARGWQAALADIDHLLALCESGHQDQARDHILDVVTTTIRAATNHTATNHTATNHTATNHTATTNSETV